MKTAERDPMNLKEIQEKLKLLRDRIQAEGSISSASEKELKSILNDALFSAHTELQELQDTLTMQMALKAGNDNKPALSEEQLRRLSIIEKTGTGSHVVH